MELSGRQLDVHTSTGHNGVKPGEYKGIRMRKWGKWVSEVRIPKSKARIWLGSYDTAQQAARAYDAAVYCLRGSKAKFNFPNSIPAIPSASSLSREQIQVAAAKYALGQIPSDRTNSVQIKLTETGVSPSRSSSVSEMEASTDRQIVSWEQFSAMGESLLVESDAAAIIPTEEQGSIFFDPTDLWSF